LKCVWPQHVVLRHQGALLLLRVTVTHTASAEEREELIGYHCFRGRLVPDTQVGLQRVCSCCACTSQLHLQPCALCE
jgi:hypothetical protein